MASESIPPDILAIIEAAANDRPTVAINVDLGSDRIVPVEFLAEQPLSAIKTVSMITQQHSDGDADQQIEALKTFLRVMVAPKSAPVLEGLFDYGVMGAGNLTALMKTLVEMQSGRPTTPSSSSATGSPDSGETSTAPSPSPVLTTAI